MQVLLNNKIVAIIFTYIVFSIVIIIPFLDSESLKQWVLFTIAYVSIEWFRSYYENL